MAKNEDNVSVLFDSLHEAFDALITMQKSSALCKVPFLKKSGKSAKKITIFSKMQFIGGFLDFFRNGTMQREEVFCVVISTSKRFI